MHLLRQICSNRRMVTQAGQYYRRFVSSTAAAQTTAAEALRVPVADGAEAPPNPKLQAIVNNIAALNLLEVSELSALLKKTLNLPDAPVVSFGAAAPAAQASAEEEEVGSGPAIVQTLFKVRLNSFDESKKIVLIKELKNQCEGMNLVQAKKFIESAPAIVKEDLSKDEADALKAALEKFGASVEVV